MNIGIVTTWFERGAAYVSKKFEEILQKENQVYIYARGGETYAIGNPLWDHPNVWWGKREYSLFHATHINKRDFIKWIKKFKIELIIFNEQQWLIPLLWCKDLEIKTLAYIDYYKKETIPLFDIYDGLICNTLKHKKAFETHKHTYYVPWGTNIDLFKPTKTDLVNDNFITYFHSAGMSAYRKGTDILIKAFIKSNQKGKLVIHTQRDLISQLPNLKDDIEYLIKSDKLELITKTITAPGLYYKGDVYVYPTRLEGIGLTIAEAISSGLACVVPNNSPMNEFISNEFGSCISIDKFFCREDAYYWPMCECSISDLTDIINKLDDNYNTVHLKKKAARLYAEEKLSYKKNFNLLNSIVRNVSFSPIAPSLKIDILKYHSKGGEKYDKYITPLYNTYKRIKNGIKKD